MKILPKENLYGEFIVPPDKSITERAIVLGGVATGKTYLVNPILNDEIYTMITCMKKLGAKIRLKNGIMEIKSAKKLRSEQRLDCGDSATILRYLCGITAGSGVRAILTGSKSLCQIPMRQVKEPLEKMGATVALTRYSVPPVLVEGASVRPVEYDMPIGFSPVKSAVLLCALTGGVRAKITETTPSRDHTEILLKEMGAKIHKDKDDGTIVLEKSEIVGKRFYICGDTTCALYYLALGLIGGKVTCRNVGINPTRMQAIDVLRRMGARIEIENKRKVSGEYIGDITAYKSKLRATHVLFEETAAMLDELPAVAVLMGLAEGESIICGQGDLKLKDFDKLSDLGRLIDALGGKSRIFDGGLIIKGVEGYKGGNAIAFDDPYVAMAAAVALTVSEQGGDINEEPVKKVYPDFFAEFGKNSFAAYGKDVPSLKSEMNYFILSSLGVGSFSYSTVSPSVGKVVKRDFSELKEYDGYNVSSKYYGEAMKRVMKLQGAAKTVRAIDLVKGLKGYAAAGEGFVSAMKAEKTELSGKRVLVVGCGVVGKSVIVALLAAKARVDVYDVLPHVALEFKKRIKENVYVLREISEDTEYDVIVNAAPEADAETVSQKVLEKCPVFADTTSYKKSKMAEICEKAGGKAIGAKSFEFFRAYYSVCIFLKRDPSEEEAMGLYGKFIKSER